MPRFRRTVPPNNKKPTNNSKIKTITVSGNNSGSNGSRSGGRKSDERFTVNRKIFADEWLKDRNGTRAYKVAYPTVKNDNIAAVLASILLRKNKVAEYIAKRIDKLSAKAQIDQEWVLERYKMLTDYCIDDFFYDDGSMKPFSEIPKEKLYAIGGFKQSKKTLTLKDEEFVTDVIKEFKLSSKKDALDSLARHLGMFEKDNAQQGKGGGINFNAPVQINVGWVEEED